MSATTTATGVVAPYGRKNPFLSAIKVRRSLTRPGSGKDTQHLELDLSGSGLHYSPGDSLGVFPRNPTALVRDILAHTGFDGEAAVLLASGNSVSLEEALSRHFLLNRANRKILHGVRDRLPEGADKQELVQILADDTRTGDYLYTRDYLDILRQFASVRFESPEAFLPMLSPIQPRLYSIASALSAHPEEVHLCVAVVRYETHGRARTGLCSGFLAEGVDVGVHEVPVYVQESPKFFLPSDTSRDVIMVGPGTGIAPFRAFLEERAQQGATGRNWLFFGEQHRATDFFYEEDFTRFQRGGVLTRFDLAFSRDQAEKIYVQHRLMESAAELWRWIEAGAYFYVCGDARRMAKDVHAALIQIVQEQGGKSAEQAKVYVEETLMKVERRYLRDVY